MVKKRKKPTPDKQETAGDKGRKRDKKGRFIKGVSGNPKGRPQGISITEMVRSALDTKEKKTGLTWKNLLVKKILLKAIAEGDRDMIKAIWNYIDGMPQQKHEVEGDLTIVIDKSLERTK